MPPLRNTPATTALTEVEIGALFQRTPSIGNAIHALVAAELIVDEVNAPAPNTPAQLSQILRRAIEEVVG